MFDIIKAELEKKNPDYALLDALKDVLQDAGTRHSINKECIDILTNSVDILKENCLNNTKTARNIMYETIIPTAKREVATTLHNIVKEKHNILNQNAVVIDLANSVRVEIGSDAEKARAELNEQWEALVEYKNKLLNLQNEENSDKI